MVFIWLFFFSSFAELSQARAISLTHQNNDVILLANLMQNRKSRDLPSAYFPALGRGYPLITRRSSLNAFVWNTLYWNDDNPQVYSCNKFDCKGTGAIRILKKKHLTSFKSSQQTKRDSRRTKTSSRPAARSTAETEGATRAASHAAIPADPTTSATTATTVATTSEQPSVFTGKQN